jgi:hypothetical protein
VKQDSETSPCFQLHLRRAILWPICQLKGKKGVKKMSLNGIDIFVSGVALGSSHAAQRLDTKKTASVSEGRFPDSRRFKSPPPAPAALG